MNRALLRNVSLFARSRLLSPQIPIPNPNPTHRIIPLADSTRFRLSGLRFFSSDDGSSVQNPCSEVKDVSVEDVSNEELKARIEKYFQGHEEALPSVFEALLRRKLTGKHEETDDELLEDLRLQPLDNVSNQDFEHDFEKVHDTDNEIDDLYDSKAAVVNKIKEDEFFFMDDKKWNQIVKDGIKHGVVKETKQCEEILEEMLTWENLLPDGIKLMIEEKFSELGDMCEKGELEPEEAHKRFTEFQDELVKEYTHKMEAAGPTEADETDTDKMKNLDGPEGDGPVLRWKTRVVISPGNDSRHPKNRLVKLGVTVKDLGLSRCQFRRLREIVGKRYHPGKDELMITSDRFDNREENRKDCLRSLLSLIEEAKKADELVDNARTAYVKERLRANPAFMERLRAKATGLRL